MRSDSCISQDINWGWKNIARSICYVSPSVTRYWFEKQLSERLMVGHSPDEQADILENGINHRRCFRLESYGRQKELLPDTSARWKRQRWTSAQDTCIHGKGDRVVRFHIIREKCYSLEVPWNVLGMKRKEQLTGAQVSTRNSFFIIHRWLVWYIVSFSNVLHKPGESEKSLIEMTAMMEKRILKKRKENRNVFACFFILYNLLLNVGSHEKNVTMTVVFFSTSEQWRRVQIQAREVGSRPSVTTFCPMASDYQTST